MVSKALMPAVVVLSLAVLSPAAVSAQSRPCGSSIGASVGGLQPYLDEPWQFIVGGSVRLCVVGRLSVEPEVAVSPGSHYERWYAVPNVIFDLRRAGGRATPYAIGGIGYGREHDKYVTWHRDYMAWYGGVGVRIALTDRLFAAPQFRLGDDEGRLAVGVGYRFGRR